jgi:hypothetical protein
MHFRRHRQATSLLLEAREVASTVAIGIAGGLAILWNTNSVLLENFLTTMWSITADYRLIGSNKPGHLTNVYGPANPRDKHAFLRNLEYLCSLIHHNRWIVGGDFNIIRSLEEKKGGSRHLDQDSNDFNSTFGASSPRVRFLHVYEFWHSRLL